MNILANLHISRYCFLHQRLLQAALPCVLFRPGSEQTKLILQGGTNADMAPQYDYWERIFLPMFLQSFRLPPGLVSPKVLARGYFPKGGGHVEVDCQALKSPLPAFDLTERGTLQHVFIRSFHAGKLPRVMASKMAATAQATLEQALDLSHVTVQTEIVTESVATGSGAGIILVGTTSTGCRLGGSTICKPRQTAEEAGAAAATELVKALKAGGCVDEWLQDQLILYMALAKGTSRMLTGCLTLHTRTAIDVAKQLVRGVQFEVTKVASGESTARSSDEYGKDGLVHGQHIITCTGIGLVEESPNLAFRSNVVHGGSIVVFAKCPKAGTSKTRLIPLLGVDGAANLAKAMLSDIVSNLAGFKESRLQKNVQVELILVYAPPDGRTIIEDILATLQLTDQFHLWPMLSTNNDLRSSDLGAKLTDALVRVRQHEKKQKGWEPGPVVFLGMDSPETPIDELGAIFSEPCEKDQVTNSSTALLCPAADGGYGLLSLPPCVPSECAFSGVRWSDPLTAVSQLKALSDAATRDPVNTMNLRLGRLMYDVDEPADVHALWERLNLQKGDPTVSLATDDNDALLRPSSSAPQQTGECRWTFEFLEEFFQSQGSSSLSSNKSPTVGHGC
jgi:RNA 3'-phosphate cyclase